MQFLISAQWIQGEAKDQGVKVSDKDVKKHFQQKKKQSFPKEADYQKFLKQSGMTQDDILFRVKLDLLSSKIRDKVTKGKGKVTEAQITAYYNKNKARFAPARAARPAHRPDQDAGPGRRGQGGARGRPDLEGRGQEVLDRPVDEEHRRPAPRA